jgi:hypothetical protein
VEVHAVPHVPAVAVGGDRGLSGRGEIDPEPPTFSVSTLPSAFGTQTWRLEGSVNVSIAHGIRSSTTLPPPATVTRSSKARAFGSAVPQRSAETSSVSVGRLSPVRGTV